MSANPVYPYPWLRFWISEGGVYVLDDETQSFLIDPEDFFGSMQDNSVHRIDHWNTHRCVVLLGEPGSGKSTELRLWRDASAAALAAGDAVVPPVIALGERDPQERLQETLGGDMRPVAAWREEECDLHLFLDSVDEGRETIANIAASLPKALASWPIDRLLLRLTCRAADWPPLLEQRLRELWGAERVAIIRLAPLRAEDVLIAARAEGLPDPDNFLDRVVEQRVGPLAALPITLKLLIEEYREAGTFPATRAALFDRGCLRLVEEVNPVRVAAGWAGTLGARRRRDIATRLAALSVFSGRAVIGPAGDAGAALGVDEACDDRDDDVHGDLRVGETEIAETLRTQLFQPRDNGRVGWVHRGLAEYLAGRWLHESGLSDEQIGSLLFHEDGGVYPQLAEVAAWVACFRKPVAAMILDAEPALLLRGDAASLSDTTRAALVDALLGLAARGEITLREALDLRPYFPSLAHPALAAQLLATFGDPDRPALARWVALAIAIGARAYALAGDAARLALDAAAPLEVRQQAALLVANSGDSDAGIMLGPLITDPVTDDEPEDLRGLALLAGWRAGCLPGPLFKLLTPPRWNGLGAYRRAVEYEILSAVSREDLPAGLAWLAQLSSSRRRDGGFNEWGLDRLLIRAWDYFDDPQVLAGMTDVAMARLARDGKVASRPLRGLDDDEPSFHSLLRSDPRRRRQLLTALAERLPEDSDLHYASWDDALATPDDVPWLLETLPDAGETPARRAKLRLIARLVSQGDDAHAAALRAARSGASDPQEAELLDALLLRATTRRAAVAPAAPEGEQEADEAGKRYGRLRDRLREHGIATNPPPWGNLIGLALWEGDDLDGREPGSWPIWGDATDEQREELVRSAVDYLKTVPAKVVGDPPTAYSGVLALRLAFHADLGGLRGLSGEELSPWCAGLLGSDLPDAEFVRLVNRLLTATPEAIARALLARIDAANTRPDSRILAGRPKQIAGAALVPALAERARDAALPGAVLSQILDLLFAWEGAAGRAAAVDAVARRDATDPLAIERGVVGALALLRQGAGKEWPAIFAALTDGGEFSSQLLGALAGHERHLLDAAPPTNAARLALYRWLTAAFPAMPTTDDRSSDGGEVCEVEELPEEKAGRRREDAPIRALIEGVCARLIERAQADGAVEELRQLRSELPDESWLDRPIRLAAVAARESAWRPVDPRELLTLARDRRRRYVAHGAHLFDLALGALRAIGAELQASNTVRFLWNHRREMVPVEGEVTRTGRQKVTQVDRYWPKDEEDLSDWLARELSRMVAGTVVNREVQVRPRISGVTGSGARTDVQLEAVPRGDGDAETIGVIIEVKGDWHDDVATAMKRQLRDDYLATTGYRHGIYVVGRFLCDPWQDEDKKRAAGRVEGTPEEVQAHFAAQASALSTGGVLLTAVIIDCGLSTTPDTPAIAPS